MSVIDIQNLTKDYGSGRGVFGVSFAVRQGEVFGFLGPNGAGKTTTIRNLMGFIRPDGGSVRIFGLDCFAGAPRIQARVGYLPGEIAFMEDMTGARFIRFVAGMKGVKDLTRARELTRFFELDPSGPLKKMSKGTKQKIGLVCAFLHDPELYILDEPTSGLDPLMQGKFVELIEREKARGKTVLMSSHMFEEVERTCDRTAIIRAGHLAAVEEMDTLRRSRRKNFTLRFADEKAAVMFCAGLQGAVRDGSTVRAAAAGSVDALIKRAACYPLADLEVRPQTLEELFLHFYDGGDAQ